MISLRLTYFKVPALGLRQYFYLALQLLLHHFGRKIVFRFEFEMYALYLVMAALIGVSESDNSTLMLLMSLAIGSPGRTG